MDLQHSWRSADETSYDVPSRDDPCAERSFHSMSLCWHSRPTLRSRLCIGASGSRIWKLRVLMHMSGAGAVLVPFSLCRHIYSGSAGACGSLCSWRQVFPKEKLTSDEVDYVDSLAYIALWCQMSVGASILFRRCCVGDAPCVPVVSFFLSSGPVHPVEPASGLVV